MTGRTCGGRIAAVLLVAAAVVGGGPAFGADVMTAASVNQEGSFEGFDNTRFLFRNSKGRLLRQHYGQVSKLTLESPLSVWVILKGTKKTQQKAVCKGYEKAKFILEQNGQIVNQPVEKIAKIELSMAEMSEERAGRSATVENINTDALVAGLGGAQPTPAQSAGVARYKESREKFDKFCADTAALKSEMERTAGPRRVSILEQLRNRKHDEQSLLDDLGKAADGLAAAFPGALK